MCIYVLPEGQAMRQSTYAWLVEHRFAGWISKAFGDDDPVYLLQDHERCLWASAPREEMKAHHSGPWRPLSEASKVKSASVVSCPVRHCARTQAHDIRLLDNFPKCSQESGRDGRRLHRRCEVMGR